MINFEKTKAEFYYNPAELMPGSNKKIYIICDYCNCEYLSTPKKRKNSNLFCDKDACKNCRYKKREDVSMVRDGVKNSSQRDNVRAKIKQANKNWINSETFIQKSKETMLKKYGVEKAMDSDKIKEKLKSTILNKYGVDNIMKLKHIAKIASEKAQKTKLNKKNKCNS